MDCSVLAPLSFLQGMFTGPQKLIQKRYDKLLDYCSRLERSSSFSSTSSSSISSSSSSSASSPSATTTSPSQVTEETSGPARRDYEALNAMLVEELQRFNTAAFTILTNSVVNIVTLLRRLMDAILESSPSLHQLPVSPETQPSNLCPFSRSVDLRSQAETRLPFQAPLSNTAEVQNSIMEELNNLTFVKDNAQKLMERKVSFERQRDKKMTVRAEMKSLFLVIPSDH